MNMTDRIRERLVALEPESLALEDESAQHKGHAGAAAAAGITGSRSCHRNFVRSPRWPGIGWYTKPWAS